MIVYDNSVTSVKTDAVLFSNAEAVRKLAIMLMVNAAEANIDMIMDMQQEYTSKPEIDAVFLHLNEQAIDMLPDHIEDLQHHMREFLRNTKFRARVTRIDYSKANGEMSDVHVELDVE